MTKKKPATANAQARGARSATGLSQRAFAKRLGVSYVTVSNWETGARRPSAFAAAVFRMIAAHPAIMSDGSRDPRALTARIEKIARAQAVGGRVSIDDVRNELTRTLREEFKDALLELESEGVLRLESHRFTDHFSPKPLIGLHVSGRGLLSAILLDEHPGKSGV